MLEHAFELMAANPCFREIIRQAVDREKPDLARFAPGTRLSADNIANKEQLIDVERVRRYMAMPVPVVYGRQLADRDVDTGFFAHLASDAFARRLVYIRPAAGQGPATRIGNLAHQQNAAVIAERSAAH